MELLDYTFFILIGAYLGYLLNNLRIFLFETKDYSKLDLIEAYVELERIKKHNTRMRS